MLFEWILLGPCAAVKITCMLPPSQFLKPLSKHMNLRSTHTHILKPPKWWLHQEQQTRRLECIACGDQVRPRSPFSFAPTHICIRVRLIEPNWDESFNLPPRALATRVWQYRKLNSPDATHSKSALRASHFRQRNNTHTLAHGNCMLFLYRWLCSVCWKLCICWIFQGNTFP